MTRCAVLCEEPCCLDPSCSSPLSYVGEAEGQVAGASHSSTREWAETQVLMEALERPYPAFGNGSKVVGWGRWLVRLKPWI